MSTTDLFGIRSLMQRTTGDSRVRVALIDGPVDTRHAGFADSQIIFLRNLSDASDADAAVAHGTAIAGVLFASRRSSAEGICPGCTMVIRPIFGFWENGGRLDGPIAADVAAAVIECVEAGVTVINLSFSHTGAPNSKSRLLTDSFDFAAKRGVIIVAATGNSGRSTSTVLTSHPWVIPVCAYDRRLVFQHYSDHGATIGRRGIGALGEHVTTFTPGGGTTIISGTSVAAASVSGVIALLASIFPTIPLQRIKYAVLQSGGCRRTPMPPPIHAESAYQSLAIEVDAKK